MRKRLSIVVLTALLLSLLPATYSGAHNAPNRCGHKRSSGAGWDRVRGHGVGCDKARRVARRWEQKCIFAGDCPRSGATRIHVRPGYRCRDRDIPGFEGVRVRCLAEENRIVHFRWGS